MEYTVKTDKDTIEEMKVDDSINIIRAKRIALDFGSNSYYVTFEADC